MIHFNWPIIRVPKIMLCEDGVPSIWFIYICDKVSCYWEQPQEHWKFGEHNWKHTRTDWEHDGNKNIKKFHPQLTRPPLPLLQSAPYLFNCPLNSHAEYVPWVLILCLGYHLTYSILPSTTDQLHRERAVIRRIFQALPNFCPHRQTPPCLL